MSDDNLTRRKFLGGIAAGAATASAGCLYDIESEGVNVDVEHPKIKPGKIKIQGDEDRTPEHGYEETPEPVVVPAEEQPATAAYDYDTDTPTGHDTPTAEPHTVVATATERPPTDLEPNDHVWLRRGEYYRRPFELADDACVSYSFEVDSGIGDAAVEAYVIPDEQLKRFDRGKSFHHVKDLYQAVKQHASAEATLDDGDYHFVIDHSDRGHKAPEFTAAHVEDLRLTAEY